MRCRWPPERLRIPRSATHPGALVTVGSTFDEPGYLRMARRLFDPAHVYDSFRRDAEGNVFGPGEASARKMLCGTLRDSSLPSSECDCRQSAPRLPVLRPRWASASPSANPASCSYRCPMLPTNPTHASPLRIVKLKLSSTHGPSLVVSEAHSIETSCTVFPNGKRRRRGQRCIAPETAAPAASKVLDDRHLATDNARPRNCSPAAAHRKQALRTQR